MKNQTNKSKTPSVCAQTRKVSVLALVCSMAFIFTACSTPKSGSTSQNVGSQPIPDSISSPQTASVEYYGKISAIAGNEIEFDLAKLPSDNEVKPEVPKDGEMAAITMTPATPAGESVDGGGAAVRTEVEYTGETKSFVVPAGVKITDPAGGEKQLSDLKKGTILSISTDNDGNVTQVIYLA